MAQLQDYSKQIGHLAARASVFKEHLEASREETSEQLKARAAELRKSWEFGAEDLGSNMTLSRQWITDRAHGLRDAVKQDMDDAKDRIQRDRAEGKASDADHEVEVAEAYATAANAEAAAAVAESQEATMAALVARAEADALAPKV